MPLFARYRQLHPGASLASIAFFDLCRCIFRLCVRVLYGYRRFGAERVPRTGAFLVVCNHQSFLDPVLAGNAIRPRQFTSLARHGLFEAPVLGSLIRAWHAVPVRQGESDPTAIRTIIGELKDGRAVLIYPEGSRTHDGALQPFARGVSLILRRSPCAVLPVAIEGAFDAWPRTRKAPRLFGARVWAQVGDPINADELMRDGPDAALRRLERTIDDLRIDLRQRMRERTRGRFPRPGAGDEPFRPEAPDTPNDEDDASSAEAQGA